MAARRRKVFKVETIGDSYVAVTGVPDSQEKHYIIMARFAVECIHKMSALVANLQSKLGPGTAELTMRIGKQSTFFYVQDRSHKFKLNPLSFYSGIHSGPVTAGVLVGDRARFQLFGDTVNTAARLERYGDSRFFCTILLHLFFLTSIFVNKVLEHQERFMCQKQQQDYCHRTGRGHGFRNVKKWSL
jgi:Adenylate and Guanylate cyclase catalytic domain